MTAREQVARLLAVVPLIARRGELPVTEVAAALGTSVEQLIADLRVLIYCGLPGLLPGDLIEVDLDALDGEGVVRIDNADCLAQPLRLSPAEAASLLIALRVVRDAAGAEAGTVDGVLAKLESALGLGRPPVEVAATSQAPAVDAARRLLVGAIRDGRRVALTYHVPSRDEDTVRMVDPVRLVEVDGTPYLLGWCLRAEAPRNFRLDRVVEVRVLEVDAPRREVVTSALDPAVRGPDGIGELVTLRLSRPARWVADHHPVEHVAEGAHGSLRVTMRIVDQRWLERLLLRLSPHVRILGDPGLRRAHHERLAAVLSLNDALATRAA